MKLIGASEGQLVSQFTARCGEIVHVVESSRKLE